MNTLDRPNGVGVGSAIDTPDYYYICGDPTVQESCAVYKTVEVNNRILVDLDEKGHVIGVESIRGLVDFEDLVDVLKCVKVKA